MRPTTDLDASDFVEDFGVGYAQAPHPVLVPELLGVPLERTPAPVAHVAADLAHSRRGGARGGEGGRGGERRVQAGCSSSSTDSNSVKSTTL